MTFDRTLIAIGLAVLVLGVIVSLGERLPIRLSRLPGQQRVPRAEVVGR